MLEPTGGSVTHWGTWGSHWADRGGGGGGGGGLLGGRGGGGYWRRIIRR